MTRERVAAGIYRDKYGYSVMARIGSGVTEQRSPQTRFPLDTDLSVMVAHWHRAKSKLEEQRGKPISRGTLAADVRTYLATATLSKQRRAERTQQLKWWTQQFGTRKRSTLESAELAQALARLKKSPSTVNKYRTALSNLYTVLDGRNAANPFRDIPRAKEPAAARRDQPYELIDCILSKIRERGRGKKPSRTRAFLLVEAYAPVTRAQLANMTRADVNWLTGEMSTPAREKGHGSGHGKRKPLSPEALDAFRAFDAAGCWGINPSNGSIYRTFKRARNAAIAELKKTRPDLNLSRAATMRPYDLRHSFATVAFQQTGDLAVTQQLLDHRDQATTIRYAQGAIDPVLKQAGAKIAAAFAARPKYTPPPPPAPPLAFPRLRKASAAD